VLGASSVGINTVNETCAHTRANHQLSIPKLLALRKAQINLAFLSFFCNFVPKTINNNEEIISFVFAGRRAVAHRTGKGLEGYVAQ
jgi:hypothetical protein